ncbi:condensation domain-containing protein [Tolypothrix bouteillei VB521301_2]
MQWLDSTCPFAKFDLTLLVIESDNELNCSWEYATDLFEDNTIQRMAEQFEVLLHGIVHHPQQTLSVLCL